ncbi:hypothetical protein Tco_0690852, partial [Tanacetum coccineum]
MKKTRSSEIKLVGCERVPPRAWYKLKKALYGLKQTPRA